MRRCPICGGVQPPAIDPAGGSCVYCRWPDYEGRFNDLLIAPKGQAAAAVPIDSPIRGMFCLDGPLDVVRLGRPALKSYDHPWWRQIKPTASSGQVIRDAANVLLSRLPADVSARARLGDASFALVVPDELKVATDRTAFVHRLTELDFDGEGAREPGWLLGYTVERKHGEVPRELASAAGFDAAYGVPRFFPKSDVVSHDNGALVLLAAQSLGWAEPGAS